MFEGLIPQPHGTQVLDLLYTFAMWHGFAKLRMHTATSLELFARLTTELGSLLRKFADEICPKFKTVEFQKEVDARNKEKSTKKQKVDPKGKSIARHDAADVCLDSSSSQCTSA